MQRNTASLMKKGSIILLSSFLFFDSFCEALQFSVIILLLFFKNTFFFYTDYLT